MARVVLDSSAVLARILDEPGADEVNAALDGARISAVNVAEIVQRLVDLGAEEGVVVATLQALPCVVESFDEAAAIRTGFLRRPTRSRGLSLGDRACIELAGRLALPVLTADRVWAELDLGVEVVLIR